MRADDFIPDDAELRRIGRQDGDLYYLIRRLEILLPEAAGGELSGLLSDVTRDGLPYTDVPAVQEAFGALMHARVADRGEVPGIAVGSDEARELVLQAASEFARVLRETGSRRAGFSR